MTGTGSEITAVVLAAGEASRFGADKLAAKLDHRSVLAHALDPLLRPMPVGRVVVVIGARAELPDEIESSEVEVVRCQAQPPSASDSLRCAIDAAAGTAVLVTLGDQPLLSRAAVEAVLARRGPDTVAVRAIYQGRPGHPVLIEPGLHPAIRELRGDRGAQALLAEAGVAEVECGSLGSDLDVDTRADLERARLIVASRSG